MRIIDADALKEAFLNHSCTEFEIKNKCRTDKNVLALIDNAPTVELRLMTVEEGAGHTIEYAMGWKACIEWLKQGADMRGEDE